MRVIYISSGNLPSRLANSIQVAKMSQALARHAPAFELVTLGDAASLAAGREFDFREWYGLNHHFRITRLPLLIRASYPFPREHRLRQFPLLATLYAKARKYEVVYTRSTEAARWAARLGCTVLLESHEALDAGYLRRLARRRVLLVTISERLREAYAAAGFPRQRVLVEHDGVDLESFLPAQSKAEARRLLAAPEEGPVVGYIGHLYDFKGIPLMYELAARLPHCRFLLVGGWDEDIRRVAAVCSQRRLDNICVAGHVPLARLAPYFFACDVLLLPNSGRHAWSETTSPLKLFEYMASGRPIVASSLPNIASVLEHGRNALLAAPDDPASFAAQTQRLLSDPPLADHVAAAAKDDVQHYTWDNRAARILAAAAARLRCPHLSAHISCSDAHALRAKQPASP
ncbi:MAG: glycosyltransferase family 4 protein [Planctomycetes bacterium]|nr:glycosyltransferase family 4 protein [Planctomycetota bacterium]